METRYVTIRRRKRRTMQWGAPHEPSVSGSRGERRRKGAGTAFAMGRKRSRADFAATIWNALAGVSFFLLLGIVGGVEQDSIALGAGAWMMAASMGAGTLFAWLAGWFL